MKNQTSKILAGLSAIGFLGLGASALSGAEVLVLQESFETDGLDSRYFAIGGGDNGETDFFARRQEFSAGTDASGGTIDGQWFWGASDIDNINDDLPSDLYPDLGARDGVLVFNDIDISGLGNLRLEMAVAQGQGTFEPDNHFRIQIRFDDVDPQSPTFGSGEWITVGGFRALSTNRPGRYFTGPLRITTEDDPRLTSEFQEWTWDIWGFGSTMDMRIVANSNWRDEDYYIDNIRIYGDDALILVDASMAATELTEPSVSEQVEVTFTSSAAAPAGGLTFNVVADEWLPVTLPMPETVTIPEGQTSLTVTLDHVADNRFTGTKEVDARFEGATISRESLLFSVTNTTPKPKVLIMEVLNVFPGAVESDLVGDANGDGARTYPGDLFVEIVNFEDFPVDLTGWTVHDDLGPRFQYPDGTIIQPGRAHVTFGGGVPTGVFGGAPILTVGTSNGFAFNTTRAEIAGLFAPFGGEMEIVDLLFRSQILETTLALPETDPAFGETGSIHRTTDEVGSGFTLHSLIEGAVGGSSLFFSPGTRPNGDPYFTPSNTVALELSSATTAEGGAAVTGNVTLSSAAGSGGLTLSVSATGLGEQVDLSSTEIMIAEGQTSASFSITPIDDAFLDGAFPVSIVVNGPEGGDILGDLASLTVEDNETNNFDFEIAEFLIDLTGTGIDPNLNGTVEQGVADQFIEIVNRSGFPVNLDGWGIVIRVDGEFSIRQPGHEFGNLWLQNDGAAVIFGEIGGSDSRDAVFGGAFVDDASNDDSAGGLHAQPGESAFVDLINQFGFIVATLEIPSSLTGQGMSVVTIDGTPALHLEAPGASTIATPGLQVDGTPYPGNGSWAPSSVLGDIERTLPIVGGGFAGFSEGFGWLFLSNWPNAFMYDGFGWLYLNDLPFIYSYDAGAWWYFLTKDESGWFWFYDSANSAYVLANPSWYPWVYNFTSGSWVEIQ